MTYERSLDALADSTRRLLLQELARGPQSVSALAQRLPVSRPAVSQHLKALKEADLATDTAEGTRRIYRINPQGLEALRQWLDAFWDTAMQNLKDEAREDD
ncbi:MAG: winged helix-turn-helix transcriptional regulator [Henriciella sp.]|nr:winged helix-turn-helix transcriptional regulator [Henriciella sp.]